MATEVQMSIKLLVIQSSLYFEKNKTKIGPCTKFPRMDFIGFYWLAQVYEILCPAVFFFFKEF